MSWNRLLIKRLLSDFLTAPWTKKSIFSHGFLIFHHQINLKAIKPSKMCLKAFSVGWAFEKSRKKSSCSDAVKHLHIFMLTHSLETIQREATKNEVMMSWKRQAQERRKISISQFACLMQIYCGGFRWRWFEKFTIHFWIKYKKCWYLNREMLNLISNFCKTFDQKCKIHWSPPSLDLAASTDHELTKLCLQPWKLSLATIIQKLPRPQHSTPEKFKFSKSF